MVTGPRLTRSRSPTIYRDKSPNSLLVLEALPWDAVPPASGHPYASTPWAIAGVSDAAGDADGALANEWSRASAALLRRIATHG